MTAPQAELTVEEGRALLGRAQRFQLLQKVCLAVAAVGFIIFLLSLGELAGIEAEAGVGGARRVPYVAYSGIVLFWSAAGVAFFARSRVNKIARTLQGEQDRRSVEVIDAELAAIDDHRDEATDDDTPAVTSGPE